MIKRCAELHLEHICSNGDPFERGSARPLDFGHWSAHALEESTNFELKHGEAVAIGILIDASYSSLQHWISKQEYQKIVELIETLGFSYPINIVENLEIDESLDNFRTHLGGELCITMLTGIGQCKEVNHIDSSLMKKGIKQIIFSKQQVVSA